MSVLGPSTWNQMHKQGHMPVKMQRNVRLTHYVGKGYKSQFECMICHRKTWQHLGFLGQRELICNGQKITKQDRKPTSGPRRRYARPAMKRGET